MIKILLAFVCALLFIQTSFAQYYNNEKELLGLIGNIKTITSESAKIIFENGKYVEKERYLQRTETYDLQGKLIKEEPVPGREGRPIVCINGKCNTEEPKQEYKYNKQGKVIEESSILMDGTMTSKRELDYDVQGKLLESRYYSRDNKGKLHLENKWVYTRKGNETKSTYYEGCCKIKRWQIAVFDSYKNLIKLSVFRPDGYKRKAAYSYEYDSKGNWTKRKVFDWVTKDGKSSFEPVEVNYRKISYYNASTRKLIQN
ncbi:MAG TPA: hypothetical protein VF540_04790 [Segetibacter sp.]|jgi:hypothetical protein